MRDVKSRDAKHFTRKTLASGEKPGKTFAIMNSEQAHPRRCGKKKAGAFTSLSAMQLCRTESVKC